MRIAVIGAGAVGGALAARLCRAGHEVGISARGEHLTAIREHGLRLQGAWGEYLAQPAAGEWIEAGAELVILATKTMDAESAVEANRHALSGQPLLVVQNGLAGPERVQQLLPGTPILGGLALFAASLTAPGTVTVTGSTGLAVGSHSAAGLPAQRLAEILAVLDQAVPTRLTGNLLGAQWTKLIINHVNAMPAITGMSVQQTIADRRLRRRVAASIVESVRLAAALGVRFAELQGLTPALLGGIRRFGAPPAELLLLRMARRMGPVPNPGSTLQSIRRGQRTEIDELNGAVVRAAQQAGTTAPVNEAIVALVHRVEQEGAFIPREEVLERLRRL